MSPRLDVAPIAVELAQLIISEAQDDRLRWSGDSRVTLLMGRVLPGVAVPQQTLVGRRRRLRKALTERLSALGWNEVRTNVYERSKEDTGN